MTLVQAVREEMEKMEAAKEYKKRTPEEMSFYPIENIPEKQLTAFLTGFTELSKRVGIGIGGCGCCGSPYFVNFHPEGKYAIEDGSLVTRGDNGQT